MPEPVIKRSLRLEFSAKVLALVRHDHFAEHHLDSDVLRLLGVGDVEEETARVECAELQRYVKTENHTTVTSLSIRINMGRLSDKSLAV